MLISKDEISKSLSSKGWIYANNNISKSFEFATYMEGIKFVKEIAEIAERNNHHPEITIGWCRVNINITSHQLGGVTTKCINLAIEIDMLKV